MEEMQKQYIKHKIPEGAIIMSRTEAFNHQMEMIWKWKPLKDVWSFKFGRAILILTAGFSSCYINYRFRRKVKMRDLAQFPTMMAVSTSSIVSVALFQTQFVTKKLVLLEVSCPLCLESKSALGQTISGLFLPLIIAPLANFTIGTINALYHIPHLTDIRGMSKITGTIYAKMIPNIAVIFTLNMLLAGFITHSQIKSYVYIQNIQYLKEQELKEERYESNSF